MRRLAHARRLRLRAAADAVLLAAVLGGALHAAPASYAASSQVGSVLPPVRAVSPAATVQSAVGPQGYQEGLDPISCAADADHNPQLGLAPAGYQAPPGYEPQCVGGSGGGSVPGPTGAPG